MKPLKKAMRPMTACQSSRFVLVAILSFLVTCSSQVACAKDRPSPETLLLKDFRPRSIYKIPRTVVEKAKYPVVDMHAHAYAKTHEQIAGWVRLMDEVGIDKAVILTGTTGKEFDDIYAKYAKYPDRFEVWCGLDYTGYDKPGFGPAAVRELERCHKVGARGVGELGDKGRGLFYSKPTRAIGMHLDDPRMDQLWEKCAELQMPVNIHVADPYWMYEPMDARNDGLMNAYQWRLDNKPNIVNHSGMLEILERGIKRHPGTTFVACHFANCSDDLSRLGRLFDKYPNLYADISARYAETAAIPRFVARFYERYQDRLVYGTDMGFGARMYRLTFRILESADEHFYAWEQFSYHWPLHGLALSDRVLRKVYRDNAIRILRSHISGSKLYAPEAVVENSVPRAADLVIRNAKVVTIDKENPRAQAVAFKGEEIVAVTSNNAIEKYIKKGLTEIIDARGRLVVPGFNDAHIHFDFIDPDYIDLRYIRGPGIITEMVKEAVAKARPGELIRGGHWEHEMFYNRRWPTKELIDPVAPNNPVVLFRADGHSVLINSYVIRNSGITKETPDPFGGEIQRDSVTGEPTGIFKEKAHALLKYGQIPVHRNPKEQQERLMRGWQAAFDLATKRGVTSIQLPPGADLDIYQRFKDMGKLTLRVYIGGPLTADKQRLKRYIRLQKKYPREGNWIRFGYLKGFIDGTLGSGTALFFDPYVDAPKKRGLPQMPYQELEKLVVTLDKAGFQMGIHAIGDKANHWVLNAFEKAQQLNGRRDSRHRIEHAQVLGDDDIPRFAELGVIASMQPTHCITDKRFAEKRIGTRRCRGAYAWQRLLDVRASIAFGSDYPVEPTNPLEGLYAAVTRKDRAGERGDGWFPDQKLSMEKAIELYTLGSAYAEFMEDRKGMIKEGYLGDVVIFNNDLMSIPRDQIMSTKVDYTIVGGEIVYKREEIN